MTAGVTRKSLDKIHDDTEYYPHQLEGIRKLANMGSFLLADEMGLGKSLQALTVAAIDFQRGWAKRVLVVCPASLKWNWEEEVAKFTHFTCLILGDRGGKKSNPSPEERRKQLQLFDVMGIDILIVNYEQVIPHLAELNALNFDIVIYDEAHQIKNHKAKRTKACLALAGRRHFLLTGSPLLNQVNELWTLLHRIDPARWPRYWPFVNKYAIMGGWQNKQIVGVKHKEELNSEIERIMVRRLKKDVLDLPDKQYIPIYVDLSPLQRQLYDEAHDDDQITRPTSFAADGSEIDNTIEVENPLARYTYLKGICGTTAFIAGYEDESSKLDAAVEDVAQMLANQPDNPTEPVVVFTQFRKVQECFVNRLGDKPHGLASFMLHGDIPKDERQDIIRQWSTWRDAKGRASALVCMLQVSGVGYNMTAASKCVFLDKLYVPKLNEQAEDRIHRIGADLTKPIQIFHYIARKTVEQRIEAILRRKTKLFDSLIEPDDWKQKLYQALAESDTD